MAKKKYIWIIGILVIVGALFFAFSGPKVNGYAVLNDFEGDITIYKSLSCGCCDVYISYFKSKGNPNINIVDTSSDNSIKTKYKVPEKLQSCHTTIIGDYFVEGHVPLEAIDKLLKEKPDIAGIAISEPEGSGMPGATGMPEGSPGMTGTKKGEFIIYAIDHNGGSKEFMRI